jgi:hypothetical protein
MTYWHHSDFNSQASCFSRRAGDLITPTRSRATDGPSVAARQIPLAWLTFAPSLFRPAHRLELRSLFFFILATGVVVMAFEAFQWLPVR